MTARVENPNQHGPRNSTAVMQARYWLTDKGYAATDAIRAAQNETDAEKDGDS